MRSCLCFVISIQLMAIHTLILSLNTSLIHANHSTWYKQTSLAAPCMTNDHTFYFFVSSNILSFVSISI